MGRKVWQRERICVEGADRILTREEACARHEIPKEAMEAYERWGLSRSDRQYAQEDLERVSMIAALYDMGFETGEVERYMRLLLSDADTSRERMKMLELRRAATLREIHLRERQLERQDYLRYQLRNEGREDRRSGKAT